MVLPQGSVAIPGLVRSNPLFSPDSCYGTVSCAVDRCCSASRTAKRSSTCPQHREPACGSGLFAPRSLPQHSLGRVAGVGPCDLVLATKSGEKSRLAALPARFDQITLPGGVDCVPDTLLLTDCLGTERPVAGQGTMENTRTRRLHAEETPRPKKDGAKKALGSPQEAEAA